MLAQVGKIGELKSHASHKSTKKCSVCSNKVSLGGSQSFWHMYVDSYRNEEGQPKLGEMVMRWIKKYWSDFQSPSGDDKHKNYTQYNSGIWHTDNIDSVTPIDVYWKNITSPLINHLVVIWHDPITWGPKWAPHSQAPKFRMPSGAPRSTRRCRPKRFLAAPAIREVWNWNDGYFINPKGFILLGLLDD